MRNCLRSVSNAVRPTDFLEEIWVRDVVDVTWKIFRLATDPGSMFCRPRCGTLVNDKASSLAEAEAELLEGTEKIEMEKLLNPDSELQLGNTDGTNIRVQTKKYQELWHQPKSTLDMTEVQAISNGARIGYDRTD